MASLIESLIVKTEFPDMVYGDRISLTVYGELYYNYEMSLKTFLKINQIIFFLIIKLKRKDK